MEEKYGYGAGSEAKQTKPLPIQASIEGLEKEVDSLIKGVSELENVLSVILINSPGLKTVSRDDEIGGVSTLFTRISTSVRNVRDVNSRISILLELINL